MARRKQLRLRLFVTAVWVAWGIWYLATGNDTFAVTVVNDTGEPVVGASVIADDRELATSDAQGVAEVEWSRGRRVFTLEAPGYLPATLSVDRPPDLAVTVQMRPSLLRGVVSDSEGLPIPHVQVSAGFGQAVTGRDGEFTVRMAEPGDVRVRRPAWEPADFVWNGSPGERTITLVPRMVKAIHVSGEAAGDAVRWDHLLSLVETTELNSIMLDLKDEYGIVYYDTQVQVAHRAGSVYPGYDLAAVARDMADRDIYLIGRIVTFQDPLAARAFPEMAVGNRVTGGVFNKGGQYFLDPTDAQARQYALDLAEEACLLGVDEIQFDYIRYPDGYGGVAVFDGGADSATRVQAIQTFIEAARDILHPYGCAVAGDIFGFITRQEGDGGIGQKWEVVTEVLDVVSPMVYPSHYSSGWYGFDRPNDHPGDMVERALGDGLERLEVGAVIRPWLQDFGYTRDQVRAQIDSAEKYGLGWMLWNITSVFSEEALREARE